ncbi:MAG: ABC transporter permease [Alkalibacterium gilvum]|uniref:ABC transporter permease n=1 Tax=Alkalibacterium gilvum TaxID=1130080 RepID=UPI003F8DAE6F
MIIEKLKNKIGSIRGLQQVLAVSLGLVLLCIVFGLMNPAFFSERNVSNLLRQIVPILIVGIGQSVVLITGNIDLSLGSIVGMSTMVSATLMTNGMAPLTAILLTLAICLLLGLFNGVLVSKFKLPPFIATLGTMTTGRGIAQIANNNYNTDAIGEKANLFREIFYYGKTLGIYNPVWIGLIIFIIINFILVKNRYGRHLYAVGSNIEASKLSGVNVDRVVIVAYLISAFCGFVVGLIATATSGVGTMDAGNMYELYAVAASVIGGISTLGGQGLLIGTVVGASIWGVLQNGLQFAGAPVAIRNIVIGLIVIISVLLDVVLRGETILDFKHIFKIKTNKTKGENQ